MTTYEIDAPLTGAPDLAPPGLVLKHPAGRRVVRSYAGWVASDDQFYDPTHVLGGDYRIEATPDTPPLTFTQFVQQFRTTVMGASHANGITISHVEAALDALGVNDIEAPLSPGMFVHWYDRSVVSDLPNGTIVRHGTDSIWDVQSWHVRSHGEWHHLLGPLAVNAHDLLLVHTMPGVERAEWVDATYSETDAEEIAAFKERAWVLGQKAKGTHSWCGQYEVAMARLGMTQAWADRPKPMPAAVVAALTVNMVVVGYDHDNPGNFGVWRRVEGADNDFGVERVFGTIEDDYPADDLPLTVAGSWGEVGAMRACHVHMVDALPIGSTMSGSGYTWTKVGEGWTQTPNRIPSSRTYRDANSMLTLSTPTIVTMGSGVYRLFSTFTDEQINDEPVGSTFLWANDDHSRFRLVRTTESGREVLVERNYDGPMGSALLVSEAGGESALPHWNLVDALPVGSVIREGQVVWTKDPRFWRSRSSTVRSGDFRGVCEAGRVTLISTPGDDVDGRVGQPLTADMAATIPVGSRVRGTRSDRLYTVTSTGLMYPESGRHRPWPEWSAALRDGALIVESIGDSVRTEWSHHGFTVDTRLNPDVHNMALVDDLPPGTQLFGMVVRRLYTKSLDGWRLERTGDFFTSVTGFSPRNCVIHALGSLDGSGGQEIVSEKQPSEHPRRT